MCFVNNGINSYASGAAHRENITPVIISDKRLKQIPFALIQKFHRQGVKFSSTNLTTAGKQVL